MTTFIELLIRFVGESVAPVVVHAAQADTLAVLGVVGVAAIAAALLVRTAIRHSTPEVATASSREPVERVDLAADVTQSNPNTAGRARPRAPSATLAIA